MARRQQRRRAAAALQAVPPKKRKAPPPRPRLHRSLHRIVRTRPLLVVAILVATHVLLALLTFEPQPHTGGDNAAYITLARSLIERGTYTELWDPAAPPHTKYPPVFPGLLALALLIGLKPWVQLKFVVLACSATAIAFGFLWMRSRRRPLLALAVAALLACAPGVLREGRWVLSDVPFWAFTMLALWAFDRLRNDDWTRFAIAALATLLAYFTRAAGLPLVLAAFAWLAWRRHWKQLGALLLVIAIPALAWWLRSRAFGPSGYASEFWLIDPYTPAAGRIGIVDIVLRVATNAHKYMAVHLPILLTGQQWIALFPLSVITFVLAAFGWFRRLRCARVADLFLPLYLGLLFIWPAVWSGERFLLPALPALLFLAGEAFVRLLRRFAARQSIALATVAAGVLLLPVLPGLIRAAQAGRECTRQYLEGNRYPCLDEFWTEYFALAELSPALLPDGSAVITRKPRLYYAVSGVPARIFPLTDDPAAFFATADSAGARYLIFDLVTGLTDYYVRPVLLQRPAAFCVMRAEPRGTVLFGIRPEHAADVGAPDRPEQSLSFAFCGDEYWRSPQARQTYSGRAR
jgi:hypothetical protein